MDCQCSSCFLLIQSLINLLTTFPDMPREGSGPVSGIVENCLANWSAVSVPSIPTCPSTHTSSILLHSASFTRHWWLPDCWQECRCSCVALFCTLHYTSLNGIYVSLEYCGVEPKNEAVTPSWAPSTYPSTSAFIDHEWFAVHISWKHPGRPHLYDGYMLHVPRLLVWSQLVDLALDCWYTSVCRSLPGPPPSSSQEEEEVPGWPPTQSRGHQTVQPQVITVNCHQLNTQTPAYGTLGHLPVYLKRPVYGMPGHLPVYLKRSACSMLGNLPVYLKRPAYGMPGHLPVYLKRPAYGLTWWWSLILCF